MIRRLMHVFIARFERRYSYDMGYVRHLLAVSWPGFLRLGLLFPVATYRDGVPLAAWYAAKLAASRAQDCGPCTQLVLNMAQADGLPAAMRRALWTGDRAAMGEDAALAASYAQAVLARSDDLADWQARVVARWGERALVSLALTMVASTAIPMFKYAIGQGHACQRVSIDDEWLANPQAPSLPESPAR